MIDNISCMIGGNMTHEATTHQLTYMLINFLVDDVTSSNVVLSGILEGLH